MITILKKEINEFLNSLIAYVVLAVFLVGTGMLLWVLPEYSVLDYGYASMEPLFTLGAYLFMFLIPAITMRSFAEERRTGTLELLYTLPFRHYQVILGKYLASLILVLLALVPTATYYYSIYSLGNPVGNLDTPGIIGSYIGLVFLAGVFTSLGLLASALSSNQIVAFVLATFLCFFFYDGVEILSAIDVWRSWSLLLQKVGILYHYETMSKGLLDLADISYFLSFIAIVLFSVHFTLSRNKV